MNRRASSPDGCLFEGNAAAHVSLDCIDVIRLFAWFYTLLVHLERRALVLYTLAFFASPSSNLDGFQSRAIRLRHCSMRLLQMFYRVLCLSSVTVR